MEGVLCTLTFRPIRGCICMIKMRFLLSMSILWLSSATVHGESLFSITPGNPLLKSQIAQNFFGVLLSEAPSLPQSPGGSPNTSPIPSPSTHVKTPSSPLESPHPSPPPNSSAARLSPPDRPNTANSNGLNSGQKTGLVLLGVAGLLQIVVVTYLVVKRKQMLQVVEKYEV